MIHYDCICLMCPTYGRHEKTLPAFITSAMEMASDPKKIRFCFVVSVNDNLTQDYIRQRFNGTPFEYEIIIENLPRPHVAQLFNIAYTQTKFNEQSTVVSMLGDDMVFITKDYDVKILQAINDQCGIGIVYCDDDHVQHEALCVNLFTTRRTVNYSGKLYMCPWFAVDWIDNVWMEVGRKLNAATYLPTVIIKHDHCTRHNAGGDAVWQRSRAGLGKEQAEAPAGVPAYTDEIACNIMNKLKELIDPAVAFVMATYDRVPLLDKAVISYMDSVLFPENIDVYDDCSEKKDVIEKIVGAMKNATFHAADEHLACNNRYGKLLREKMADPKIQAVMICDSDTLFSSHWMIKLMDLWNEFKGNENLGAISLFDAPQHTRDDAKCTDTLTYKRSIGGFGVLLTRRVLEPALSGYNDVPGKTLSWDNQVNAIIGARKMDVILPARSFLQHMGFSWGHHKTDAQMGDFAPNFVGESKPPSEYKRPSGNPPRSILWASMGRMGDVIMSSMIANMLISQGVRLTWIVIPKYAKLVSRICPLATVIQHMPNEGPDALWSETTEAEMKQKYAGREYQCFINAQVGARENHDRYIRSGRHPCEWLRIHVEGMTGITLSPDYRGYLRFKDDNVPVKSNYLTAEPKRPLAIIAPVAQTSPCLSPERVDQIYAKLKADGYYPLLLVEKKPRIPINQLRNKYLWGMTEIECIKIIQRAALFVGQDSGLAWCSLFSKCRKEIYHSKSRLDMVNTRFEFVDPGRAQDIVA